MYCLVTTLLITMCVSTLESNLPEHPRKSYYKHPSLSTYNLNTTPKSKHHSDLFAHNVRYPYPPRSPYMKGIQYAPLYATQDRKGSHDKELFTQDLRPTPTARAFNAMKYSSTHRTSHNKGHLEPRVESDLGKGNEDPKCYSPGLKVKGTPFVSRSPGHNVVYQRIQSQQKPSDKAIKPSKAQEKIKFSMESTKKGLHKITYMRPFPVLQNLQQSDSTTVVPAPVHALNPIYAVKGQKLDSDRKKDPAKSKRQPASASSKLHRLHLNIARVYSPGQVPPKSPVFIDLYPLPDQSQGLLLPGSPLSNKNTIMLPVPKVGKYI